MPPTPTTTATTVILFELADERVGFRRFVLPPSVPFRRRALSVSSVLVPGKQEVNKNLPLFLTLLITNFVHSKKFGSFEIKFGVKKI
jgi:hypothetical protein